MKECIDDIAVIAIHIPGAFYPVYFCIHNFRFNCWLNICPHAGRRLDYAPGQFLLDQGRLVCAAHGASFELEQGVCVAGPCRGASLVPLAVAIG